MRLLGRIGLGLLALIMLAAVSLAVWEPLAARPGVAPPARTYDTVIARDRWGVPHVFGRTDADVAHGVAYAHAEDDFSTLQDVLALTRGRLGAITGQEGAKTDYAVHLLDARATVARDYDKLPADVRALLDGYAAGLNRYAARHGHEVKLRRLFPVDGRDVATGFVVRLPFFFGLDQVLGPLAGDDPLPPDLAGPAPDAPNVTPVGPTGPENGSNAFAIAPRRSADEHTRLLSNSHQPWRGGVAWYELVVHSGEGWNFAGATFPGSPFPFLGHNEFLGWTNTVNRPDLIDVYRLATDGDSYRYDGAMRALEKRRVWLPVKLWRPFTLPVPRTVHRAVQGPVMRGPKGDFAIRYAGADQLRMLEQYYRINKARSWGEWERAMAIMGVPATNFIYADRTGRIAMIYNAAFLNRRPGFDYSKPLPGDTSRAFTPGSPGWAAAPKNVDPASGFIQNANNTPYQAAGIGSEIPGQPPLLGVETDTTNRGTRAMELLGADGAISEAELLRIKFDTGVSKRSWAGRWFDAVMRSDGDAEARRLLARWDWNFDGRGPADALAAIVLRAGNAWHYRRLPMADPAEGLNEGAKHLRERFGRLDPPLSDVLRLRQGKVDLPLDGGPDVLRAMALWDVADDGRLAVRHGDSFQMLIGWDREGRVRSRSIQPFGSATTRPDSPHYADQAPLFVRKEFKPVWFSPRALRGNTERVYRP